MWVNREGRECALSSTAPLWKKGDSRDQEHCEWKLIPQRLALIIFDISRKFQSFGHLSYKEQQKKSPDTTRASDERESLCISHGSSHFSSPEPSSSRWSGRNHLQPGQPLPVRVGSENGLQGFTSLLSLEVQLRSPGWSWEADPSSPWTRLNCTLSALTQILKPTVKSQCLQKTLLMRLPAQVTFII